MGNFTHRRNWGHRGWITKGVWEQVAYFVKACVKFEAPVREWPGGQHVQKDGRGFPAHRGIYSVHTGRLGSGSDLGSPSLAAVCPVSLFQYKDSFCDMEPYLLREKIVFLSDSFIFWELASWFNRGTGPRVVRKLLWVHWTSGASHGDLWCLAQFLSLPEEMSLARPPPPPGVYEAAWDLGMSAPLKKCAGFLCHG